MLEDAYTVLIRLKSIHTADNTNGDVTCFCCLEDPGNAGSVSQILRGMRMSCGGEGKEGVHICKLEKG